MQTHIISLQYLHPLDQICRRDGRAAQLHPLPEKWHKATPAAALHMTGQIREILITAMTKLLASPGTIRNGPTPSTRYTPLTMIILCKV